MHHYYGLVFPGECPDEGDDPADEGPSQEQVDGEDAAEIVLVVGKDRRQKI